MDKSEPQRGCEAGVVAELYGVTHAADTLGRSDKRMGGMHANI